MLKNAIKSFLRPVKRLVKRAIGQDRLHARIDHLGASMSTFGGNTFIRSSSFQIAPWYDQNLCEPTVQVVLRDLCRPGDTVFDVGANAGSLSLLMSRLVGVRGVVCSFEASRRIVDKTQYNLVVNGCSNVQLYHRAIYHTSGQIMPIFFGSHLNDSLLAQNDAGVGMSEVETLAIDDFVAYTGLEPKLIKMDIEGAEFDALRGAEKLIARARPTFLLEQQLDDMRCLDLLKAAGYISIDLATYRVITGATAAGGIANVLCIHQSKIAATPYEPPFLQEPVAELPGPSFQRFGGDSLEASLSLKQAGRYILDFDFAASGANNDVMMGVEYKGSPLVRYHAYSSLLANNYRQIPCDVKRPASVTVFFRFMNGTSDPTLRFRKVTVNRLVKFDSVSRPLVD